MDYLMIMIKILYNTKPLNLQHLKVRKNRRFEISLKSQQSQRLLEQVKVLKQNFKSNKHFYET